MESILIVSLSIAYLLTTWYKTNVLLIYLKKFKLLNFLAFFGYPLNLFKDYWEQIELRKQDSPSLVYKWNNFLEYLGFYYPDSFYVELFRCPICLGFYLSLIGGFFVGFQNFLAVAFLSCLFYFSLSILFNKQSHPLI